MRVPKYKRASIDLIQSRRREAEAHQRFLRWYEGAYVDLDGTWKASGGPEWYVGYHPRVAA